MKLNSQHNPFIHIDTKMFFYSYYNPVMSVLESYFQRETPEKENGLSSLDVAATQVLFSLFEVPTVQ